MKMFENITRIDRAGGTTQLSRQLPRAAGILGQQIVSGGGVEKEKGKVKKLRKVKEEKKESDKER